MNELDNLGRNYFFITGCYRSGTTLLDKYLSNHADCLAFSQSLTPLFIATKKIFYEKIRSTSKKFLGIGVPRVYESEQFDDFLDFDHLNDESFQLLQDTLGTNLDKRSRLSFPMRFPKSDFRFLYLSLLELLYRNVQKPVQTLGLKEILGHEFIAHLINRGVKVIVIVRDPRKVIESLNYGTGGDFTGGIRPTLLNLHNWREVAEAGIEYKNRTNFMLIKYEDFISDKSSRMELLDFLELQTCNIDINNLKNLDGTIWTSNSSFSDRPREIIDQNVARYIESICYLEMQELGYHASVDVLAIPEIIKSFEEPWIISPRDYYETNYSTDIEYIKFEIERWGMKLGIPRD